MAAQPTGAEDYGPVFKRYFNSPTLSDITLRYGTNGEKKFYGHKIILCAHSSWFRVALTRNFEESEAKELLIQGPDGTSAEAIETMLRYMYEGTDPTYCGTYALNNGIKEGTNVFICEATFWIEVFVLSDYYNIESLKSEARGKFFNSVTLYFQDDMLDLSRPKAEEELMDVVQKIYCLPEMLVKSLRDELINVSRVWMDFNPRLVSLVRAIAQDHAEYGRDLFCSHIKDLEENGTEQFCLTVMGRWQCANCGAEVPEYPNAVANFCSNCGGVKAT